MDTVPPGAAAPPRDGFLPLPAAGRVFTGDYPIRSTDVTPGGTVSIRALSTTPERGGWPRPAI